MAATNTRAIEAWTLPWAALFALGCFLAGMGGGWLLRELQGRPGARTHAAVVAAGSVSAPQAGNGSADSAAAPLLEKLQADPNNPDLLISVGNVYYDAQQYPAAIAYYARALSFRPSDADVRTDRGTAYWYMGNADRAIAEFHQALSERPNNPNTLFNLGLVKLQGKRDAAGAVADWKKLLATAPDYPGRDKVEQMISKAETH